MKVWMVVQWHTPSVAHGYEPEMIFAKQSFAEDYAANRNAEAGITPLPKEKQGAYYANQDEWTVEEWVVE